MAGRSLTITDLDNGKRVKPTTKQRAKARTSSTSPTRLTAGKNTKTTTRKKVVTAQKTATTPKVILKKTAAKTTSKAVVTKKSVKKTVIKKGTLKATKKVKSTISTTVKKSQLKNTATKTSSRQSAPKKAVLKKTTKTTVAKSTTKQKTTTPIKKIKTVETMPVTEPVLVAKAERVKKSEPLGHLLAEQLLREAGFAGGVSTNKEILDRYTHDESIFAVRPQIVLQPKHQRDIEIAVKVLSKQTKRFPSLSLTPRAAGTGLSGGSLTDSVVIDVCRHMHHIDEPQKRSGGVTITVEPGAMWRDVEKTLKKEGVYIPSYPASKDICSIGGAIGNNAAGPDSLRFGHCANWVESLNVTLYDGNTYTLKPITYKEFKSLTKKNNALATILSEVFSLIEQHETTIKNAKPKTKKNSAGYALWDVLDGSVASFKRGKATLDLTRLISGSQGTIGVITSITLKTEPIRTDTELIVVPVFDLMDAGHVIEKALEYSPINVEIFDGLTFNLALQNPNFFKDRLGKMEYYKVLLSMYTLYHVRYARKVPEFTLLITLDHKTLGNRKIETIIKSLREHNGKRARHITNPTEQEMFWQIRRASYTLSKFQDKNKRPAAFLEDMTVPPKNISKFLVQIKKLLKKFNVTAAVHGHGGNGHFHFYPLLDFTQKGTAQVVEKMAEEFFSTAVQFDGNICGEHNDGIIRTPHLSKMFNKTTLQLFEKVEHIFDPDDIFNPGKKVHPKFDVKDTLRKTN